jgi:hypothetical protein
MRVLSAGEASVPQKLLDSVIQAAVVKDEALAAVERLGKLCTLDAFRDVLADGALGQCARPLHAIIARPKFGTALKHPVTVCLPNMASGI